jgi:hypothetical protein
MSSCSVGRAQGIVLSLSRASFELSLALPDVRPSKPACYS